MRVCAIYRCRHCGAVYKAGEFDVENLSVVAVPVGLYERHRVLPDPHRAAMWDIHTCDGCVPKFGIGDLVGWEGRGTPSDPLARATSPVNGGGKIRENRKMEGFRMNEMERGSISALALEGLKRGLSYGQYVAARYYPVTVVEKLPDGGEIVRCAALPPIVPGWEDTVARMRSRSINGPVKRTGPKKEKPQRLCVVCGKALGPNQRRYCSDDCRVQKLQAEGRTDKGYKKVPRLDRPCAVCGRMMQGVLEQQKYCGPQCRDSNKYRAKARDRQELQDRHCQICGSRIEGKGIKYCANCAAAENARRNRERKRARTEREG